jgi:dienelactone hydrolase
MTTMRLPLSTLVLGLLGIATAWGCSDDGGAEPGAGGSSAAGGGGSGATAGAASGGGPIGASGAGSGGVPGTSGAATMGGSATAGASGAPGSAGTGGVSGGGAGGSGVIGGASGAGGNGGASAGAGGTAAGGAGGQGSGTCTASKATGRTVSGTGPHQVVIETNSENGIKCGTIYRPKDLGGAEKYPILVWGEGGCGQNGYDNIAAMGEIASWGYFIVADGTPGGTNACAGGQNGKAFLDYITWAIAENGKSCSAYHQSLDTTKIAADGFSCGGLMAANVSGDPRFTAIGITSSGLMSANDALYDKIHTPYKIMNGGTSDIAYENGLRDYEEISARGKPIIYFSKSSAGHGGDLGQARGDFNKVNLAWLNWQLKGDMGATGKGFLQGATCSFCTANGWTYKAANLP